MSETKLLKLGISVLEKTLKVQKRSSMFQLAEVIFSFLQEHNTTRIQTCAHVRINSCSILSSCSQSKNCQEPPSFPNSIILLWMLWKNHMRCVPKKGPGFGIFSMSTRARCSSLTKTPKILQSCLICWYPSKWHFMPKASKRKSKQEKKQAREKAKEARTQELHTW